MTATPRNWRPTQHPCGCVSRFDLDRMRGEWTYRCKAHSPRETKPEPKERSA